MSDRPDELLDELRRLAGEVDPVPPEVASFAKAALGWRRIDADLAELLSDSALETETAFTRGTASARSVTFRGTDLEVDVEIHEGEAAEARVFLGQIAPPGSAAIEVQRDDSAIAATVQADELGRFRIELETGGRLRLRVLREPPAQPVETSWIVI